MKRDGLVVDARGVLLVCGAILFASAILAATSGCITNLLTGVMIVGQSAVGVICIVGALRAH